MQSFKLPLILFDLINKYFRYVNAGGNDNVYTFIVPIRGCGSRPSCSICGSVDNILIIQTDDDVQEIWDSARKITCETSVGGDKTVIFKPFVVDMLEVVNVPTQKGAVDCWMDIQSGSYPNVRYCLSIP